MTLQNVCIRVDASFDIGTGHVIRCLTLAKELQKKGCTVSVITRPFPGNLLKLIRDNGCDVYLLPEINEDSNMEEWNHHSRWLGVHWQTDAKQTIEILKTIGQIDILIVDHYAIDYQWEQVVRPYALKLMVIDDLADRIHACDLLLDQNYASNGSDRYARLVPEQCKTYLGPAYALLREEFRFQRALLQPRTGEKIKDIFLFFGGSDPTGQTLKLLEWMEEIEEVQETVDIHVIVGVSNPHKDQIEWRCTQTKNMHYYYNVTNILPHHGPFRRGHLFGRNHYLGAILFGTARPDHYRGGKSGGDCPKYPTTWY